nr:phage terminase small subunit [Paenibacillus xylanexedens]
MKPKEIAEKLGVTPESVRKWKSLDQWEDKINNRPGAPRGNKNARGNRGGKGGPPGNQKAVTHDLFRKFEPQDPEYLELIDIVQQMDPIDMIWENIKIGFGKIIWAQRIFCIKDKEDMTKELKREKPGEYGDEYKWEI